MKSKLMILVLIGITLSSCAPRWVSSDQKGPNGPLGPSVEDLSASSNTIVIKDTGELVSTDYPFQDFTKLEVGGFFTAEINQGDEFRVLVEAEEALKPYIDVDIQGKTLKIGLSPDHKYSIEKSTHRVVITLPVLTQIHATGHSTWELMNFASNRQLRIDITEFSVLTGMIEADDVNLAVADHSSIVLRGSASSVRGDASNHSTVDLSQLDAAQIDVDVDQFSTVKQ